MPLCTVDNAITGATHQCRLTAGPFFPTMFHGHPLILCLHFSHFSFLLWYDSTSLKGHLMPQTFSLLQEYINAPIGSQKISSAFSSALSRTSLQVPIRFPFIFSTSVLAFVPSISLWQRLSLYLTLPSYLVPVAMLLILVHPYL